MRLNVPTRAVSDEPVTPAAPNGAAAGQGQLRTRREAVNWGIRCFVGVAVAACIVTFLIGIATHAFEFQDTRPPSDWWRKVGVSLALSLPLAALLGAVSGHEHYRRAAGQKRLRAGIALLLGLSLPFFLIGSPATGMILMGIGVFWTVHCINGSTFTGGPLRHWPWLMVVLGAALLVVCCAICASLSLWVMDGCLGACTYCTFFLSDALVTLRMSVWARDGHIERQPHKFQFSLASMLVFCIALGAYALALASFFPPRW